MKNNKVNDPQGIIQAITERLETTLENIEVQKGQVLIDDIEKIEFCIGALKNLMIKQDEEQCLLLSTQSKKEYNSNFSSLVIFKQFLVVIGELWFKNIIALTMSLPVA